MLRDLIVTLERFNENMFHWHVTPLPVIVMHRIH